LRSAHPHNPERIARRMTLPLPVSRSKSPLAGILHDAAWVCCLPVFLLLISLLVPAINGNQTAQTYLTGLLTWVTGGAWPEVIAIVLAVLVPSPVGRLIEQAL